MSLDQCDPLNTQACLLPFPSDYNMVDDDSTFTGKEFGYSKILFRKHDGVMSILVHGTKPMVFPLLLQS